LYNEVKSVSSSVQTLLHVDFMNHLTLWRFSATKTNLINRSDPDPDQSNPNYQKVLLRLIYISVYIFHVVIFHLNI